MSNMPTKDIQKKYTVVDLFARAGGLSYDFMQTGRFQIIAAAENNRNAQLTYEENQKNVKMFDNVTKVTAASIQELGSVDVVIGGPPCHGFSNANRQKNTAVSMNNRLVKEYVRVITELQPTVFVMENVSMLKSSVHRFYLEEDDAALGIKDMEMTVDKIELLSHRFNLAIFDDTTTKEDFEAIINNPQFIAQYQWSQERCLLFNSIYKVATQKTDKEQEKKTQHEKLLERIAKHKNQLIKECTSILENADVDNEISRFDCDCARLFNNIFDQTQNATAEPIKAPKKDLAKNSLAYKLRNAEELYNHVNTATRPTAKKRFETLQEGEKFHNLPKDQKTTYTKGERTQNTIYLKLKYDEPSGTVVNVRKSMWIHPAHSRALSIREAARLQTFPDKFKFKGTKDSQYQQVGNAVPPLFGEEIAKKIIEILD